LGSSGSSGSSASSGGGKSGGGTRQAGLVIDEFEFDKTTIPAKWVSQLKQLCALLVAQPGAAVVCTGNTDTVGSEQYNYKLGLARATAVRDFMVKQGVDAKTIKVESKGEMQPAEGEPPAKHDPDPGQKDPKNRRVEVEATWPSGGGKGKSGPTAAGPAGSKSKTAPKAGSKASSAKSKGGAKGKR
jgi:OmpA family protein